MMKLHPFVQVDDTPFSATEADVRRAHGTPGRAGRNGVELNELDYGTVVYRFQDCGRLEEITREAPVLSLVGTNIAIPFAALAAFLREQDPTLFERAGFLISPKFGLAFDPRDGCWVTALAEHCIETWREL